ncbi:MAG: HAD hydrolase-like protein [Christensenellales bacterium]|jgi:phosphoglycolate phosphatase
MRFQNVLMDFDGTIARTGDGIINGVEYACRKMGYTDGSPWEDWRRYIGPTVYKFTTSVLGMTESQRDEFMAHYSEYYKKKGIYEGPAYPGMAELIEELHNGGAKVYVCTCKPEELTLLCIDYLKLRFDGVVAMVPGRVTKDDVVRHCLNAYELDPKASVMIGDRDSDIFSGKKFGTSTIAVTYGYGSVEEMTACGADFVARSVEDLKTILTGG